MFSRATVGSSNVNRATRSGVGPQWLGGGSAQGSLTPLSARGLARLMLFAALTLLLGLGPMLGSAATTMAAQYRYVNFVNQTGDPIEFAVVMREDINCGSEGWIFTGWLTVYPGQTKSVQTIGSRVYFHGRSWDGSVYDGKEGVDDQITLWASRDSFEWCQYDSSQWLNLIGGGVVATSAENYEIELKEVDVSGGDSTQRFS